MKILTWDTPNFGDRLNDIVWPHYLPNHLDDDPSELLVGIGSLLNHRLPAAPPKWIFGAGIGHGDPPTVDDSWRVLWVRGPRSADGLGQRGHRYITDGAMLLGDIFEPPAEKRFPCAFIPHCSAVERGALLPLREICENAGLHLINPHWPVRRVVEEIGQSERVISEALHGAIVADAFRVPWIPASRGGVLALKWLDWSESLGLAYEPVRLPYRPQWLANPAGRPLSRRIAYPFLRPTARLLLERRLRRLAQDGPWRLSPDRTLANKVAEMKECLARFESRTQPLSAARR
ncbi:MAG: succinoglycan biosynthesis ketolase [Rhodocyclaceae bacterium]|nr:succinoglycan biosynthesis ketolase [Rhodocyclaceae bacterium]